MESDIENTQAQAEQLRQELEFRNQVLRKLEEKKAVSENDRQRGELDRAYQAVEQGTPGWQEMRHIKGIIRDQEQQQRRIKRALDAQEARRSVDSIITTYNFHVKSTGNLVYWYQSPVEDHWGVRTWHSVKTDALRATFPALDVVIRYGEGAEDYSSLKEFNKKLVEQGRTFTHVIQSYRSEPGALNIMNQNRCRPASDGASDYHWIFDAIIESISGGVRGSPEFEAFQKTLWAKYLHPENIYLPHISVRDVNGRAGKSLFSNTFLRTLFSGNIADNCNIDHIIGKFNSVIAGRSIIVVNETNRKRVDHDRTKAFLMSPSVPIERKGEDIYYADNCALVLFYTNDAKGGLHVSGTTSDQRVSFFSSVETIYQAVQRHFEQQGQTVSQQEAKHWIEGTLEDSGQMILSDSEQVGRWINAMALRWGDIVHLDAYHDKEYQHLVDSQRGAWLSVVERVFEEYDFEYIRIQLLNDLIRHFYRGDYIPGRNIMIDEIDKLIQDRGYDIERVQRAHIKDGTKTVQRPVYRRRNLGVCSGIEIQYGNMDDHGRWIWTWQA